MAVTATLHILTRPLGSVNRHSVRRLMDPPPLIRDNDIVAWSLDNAIQRHVMDALAYCDGNIMWAAAELGIARMTLTSYLDQWDTL